MICSSQLEVGLGIDKSSQILGGSFNFFDPSRKEISLWSCSCILYDIQIKFYTWLWGFYGFLKIKKNGWKKMKLFLFSLNYEKRRFFHGFETIVIIRWLLSARLLIWKRNSFESKYFSNQLRIFVNFCIWIPDRPYQLYVLIINEFIERFCRTKITCF